MNEGTPGHPQNVIGNPAASFHVSAGFFIDPLTAVMLCVVMRDRFLHHRLRRRVHEGRRAGTSASSPTSGCSSSR